MTDSGDTTMAPSEAAGDPFKMVMRKNRSKRLKAALENENPIERTHSFTIRTYFPPPRANVKFNPAANMRAFLIELLKYEPSLILVNPTTKEQTILTTTPIPTNEAEFKKLFNISTDSRAGNQQRIVVGCHLRSERTINEIKFDKNKPQFLEWLTNQNIFIESDNLGADKTVTIGYLMKLHPQLTNRTKLKSLLETALEDIVLDPDLATELDPSLKDERTTATSNGDLMIPAVPPFEIFKTKLTFGKDKNKVHTKVLGIKCAYTKAKLLKEFFSQRGSPTCCEKLIGMFVPTGAVNLLGAATYEKLIRDNNLFLDNITTIPMGDFQHETLDIPFSLDSSTDIEQVTLQELIEEQDWCLNVDKTTTTNKVLITTTKPLLQKARDWLDLNLPNIYVQHIDDKIDVTTLAHITPRCLDKPNLTVASRAYAAVLQSRTSTPVTNPENGKKYAQPPRMKKPTLVGITFDESAFPALQPIANPKPKPPPASTANKTTVTSSSQPPATTNPAPVYDYKKELERISNEIETTLKKQFETMFAQLEQKLDRFIRQSAEQRTEQEKFNAVVTQRLGYLVDNMQRLFNLANIPADGNYPSPMEGEGCS